MVAGEGGGGSGPQRVESEAEDPGESWPSSGEQWWKGQSSMASEKTSWSWSFGSGGGGGGSIGMRGDRQVQVQVQVR